MTDNSLGAWATSIADQIEAAVAENNWPAVAQLGVDGWILASRQQHPDGSEVPLEEAVTSMLHLRHENLVLFAAEALRRLYNQEIRP